MRTLTLYTLTGALILGSLSALWSQTPPAGAAATGGSPSETADATPIPLEDFNPIAFYDVRLGISDVNFFRRYHASGIGEFLDVVVDIKNNTNDPIDLTAYVIAYNETNAVDVRTRQLIPYPTWRDNDPDKYISMIHNVNISPVNIPETNIWSQKDPDYQFYKRIIHRMQNSIGTIKPIPFVMPPLWKYISYLTKRPEGGLTFKLYGDKGPTSAQDRIKTNYVPQTPEEKVKKIHDNLNKHTYTVEFGQRHTVLRTHHFAKFKEGYKFYNRVTLLIFDASKIKDYEEQSKRELKEGEEPIQPLIFKRTYLVDVPQDK